jgi:hypothetical protein
MQRIATIIALILFCTCAAPASAQESPADWAGKLGSRSYAEREKAARALEKLGSAALPVLRAAMTHADLETKRRAILLMERIEDRLIVEELMTATPVRLRFQDLPVEDALVEIEKQMGLRLGNVTTMKRISLDTGVLPYWQAWRRFCVAAHLEERDFARSAAKLRRLKGEHELLGLLASGRVSPPNFSASRLEFAAEPPFDEYAADDRGSVRIRLKWHALDTSIDAKIPHVVFAAEVRTEPQLEVMSVPTLEITKVIDDMGRVCVPASAKMFHTPGNASEARFLAAVAGEIQYDGMLHLKAIPWQGPSRRFKEVHGRVRLDARARPRMMEMPGVLKSVGKEMRGEQGITVKILEAETTDDGDIHLRLYLDRLDSLTPRTAEEQIVRVRPGVIAVRGVMDVALERLELVDAGGRKCRQIKGRYEQAAAGKGYEADLLFAAPFNKAEELTLVMTKAMRTVPLEIPFLVRDVVWTEKEEVQEGK